MMELVQSPVVSGVGEILFVEAAAADDYGVLLLWQEAFDQWLEAVKAKSNGGSNTVAAYRVGHKQFFSWAGVRPWQVTPGIVQAWVNYLRREGKAILNRKTGEVVERKPLSGASINQKLAGMRSFYDHVQMVFSYPRPRDPNLNYFLECDPPVLFLSPDRRAVQLWPATWNNPFNAKTIGRTKIKAFGRATSPTPDEIKAMLKTINTDCASGKRDLALLVTLTQTCRRSSEVLNLKCVYSEMAADGNYTFRYRYKGGEIKKAKMDKLTFRLIWDYLEADGRLVTIRPDDYIFVPLRYGVAASRKLATVPAGFDGAKPISNTQANNIIKKYAKRAGVDPAKAHVHGLRHGGAKLRAQIMRQQGRSVDFAELMNLLGHSSLAVTQIYAMEVLEEVQDPTGTLAAQSLMGAGQRKKKRAAAAGDSAGEQGQLW